ncbi:MAG: lysophospholipase [Deltaproteobacteria bacterium]|nr:lysophospholipase [Deltaproteobacteria bacterium]
MDTLDGKLTSGDGLSLFWKAWLPDGSPKAALHIIHGYAEHIDRYQNVIDELVPAGYVLFGNDHRGHGRSDGKRGYVNSFQEFLEDEKLFRAEVIKRKFPGIPYFILGHSMGSLIAMNFVEQDPDDTRGLILSGTGSGPGPEIGKALLYLTKILSGILPGISVKSPLPPEFISRDPDVVKAYKEDPLVYNVITPRLAEQMNTYTTIGADNAGKIKVPVLIQYGSIDTSFSGQERLYDLIGASDKTIKRYDGLKHEVYNELPEDRAIVLKDLHEWLDGHL